MTLDYEVIKGGTPTTDDSVTCQIISPTLAQCDLGSLPGGDESFVMTSVSGYRSDGSGTELWSRD